MASWLPSSCEYIRKEISSFWPKWKVPRNKEPFVLMGGVGNGLKPECKWRKESWKILLLREILVFWLVWGKYPQCPETLYRSLISFTDREACRAAHWLGNVRIRKIKTNSDIGGHKDTNDRVEIVTWEIKKLGDTESRASETSTVENIVFSLGEFCPVNLLLSYESFTSLRRTKPQGEYLYDWKAHAKIKLSSKRGMFALS